MFTTTTTGHRTIVTMLADGRPVWYVAAATKTRAHDVHRIGTEHGYPDRAKLSRAIEMPTKTAHDAEDAVGQEAA